MYSGVSHSLASPQRTTSGFAFSIAIIWFRPPAAPGNNSRFDIRVLVPDGMVVRVTTGAGNIVIRGVDGAAAVVGRQGSPAGGEHYEVDGPLGLGEDADLPPRQPPQVVPGEVSRVGLAWGGPMVHQQ